MIYVFYSRLSTGLEISWSKKRVSGREDTSLNPGAMSQDDVFGYSANLGIEALQDIKHRTPAIYQSILDGKPYTTLIPERSPRQIVVSKKTNRRGYFNVGELIRPRFLQQPPTFPLKHYQKDGCEWLAHDPRRILADDMGLGKTLQTIAAMDRLLREGQIKNVLVLCPKSLIGNWAAELSIWAPHLCAITIHARLDSRTWQSISKQTHLAITNYESIRSSGPAKSAFDLVVFDELHKLKNAESLAHKAARALEPARSWGLTGTPLENKPSELISILKVIDTHRISETDKELGRSSIRALLRRYTLRRTKEVLADELTRVAERIEKIPLSAAQREAYSRTRVKAQVDPNNNWLATFGALRNICDFDPDTGDSSKLDRATDILISIVALKEKAVVFSYRLTPLELLSHRLSVTVEPQKIEQITGDTDSQVRTSIVSRFQKDDDPSILLCSLKAAGEGLTLTAANHVVFINEWWNPAINVQARDRVNRIGQKKPVYVYRLRTTGTVEDHLGEILENKQEIFDDLIGKLTSNLGNDNNAKKLAKDLANREEIASESKD